MERTSVVLFKVCLVAYALLAIGIAVEVLVTGFGPLPEPALAYLAWWSQQPQSDLERALGWIGTFALAISVISALAMINYARWARPLFAACIVVMIASEPFMDFPVLKSPTEYLLDTLLGVFTGSIIVFAYWSRVSDGFAKNAP